VAIAKDGGRSKRSEKKTPMQERQPIRDAMLHLGELVLSRATNDEARLKELFFTINPRVNPLVQVHLSYIFKQC
jgi:hypothetical protein